jgi:hypothetical protein
MNPKFIIWKAKSGPGWAVLCLNSVYFYLEDNFNDAIVRMDLIAGSVFGKQEMQ